MVQLDHDEEMEPMHGMYGTLDAELEVQRTIKRVELTACVSSGHLSVLRWCTLRCIGPRATGAHLWILIWDELHRFRQEGTLVEVEPAKVCGSKQVSVCEMWEEGAKM